MRAIKSLQLTAKHTNEQNEIEVLTKWDQYVYLTTTHWSQRNARPTSLDVALLESAGPVDHHTAAILPIAGANEFPWKEAAKEILVYICQKPPRFSLSKLPLLFSFLVFIGKPR